MLPAACACASPASSVASRKFSCRSRGKAGCRHTRLRIYPQTVVVVIRDGHAHAQAHPFQSGFFRDVFEGAIRFLVKHPVPVTGTVFLWDLNSGFGVSIGSAIQKVKIEPSIIVAVEEAYTRAHSFNLIFGRGVICVVQEVNAGFLADVDELSRNKPRRRNASRLGRACSRKVQKIRKQSPHPQQSQTFFDRPIDAQPATVVSQERPSLSGGELTSEYSNCHIVPGYFVALPDLSSRRSDLITSSSSGASFCATSNSARPFFRSPEW